MKISIAKRRTQVSETLQSYVLEKVGHLAHYFPSGIISVDVVFDAEKERKIVEMVAHLVRKKIVKASAETDDLQSAVDASVEKLRTQLIKHKDQMQDKRPRETGSAKSSTDGANHRDILRSQVYLRKPMTTEEAIMQLESYQKKNFLIYLDAESEMISILHRLENGQYELIEPIY